MTVVETTGWVASFCLSGWPERLRSCAVRLTVTANPITATASTFRMQKHYQLASIQSTSTTAATVCATSPPCPCHPPAAVPGHLCPISPWQTSSHDAAASPPPSTSTRPRPAPTQVDVEPTYAYHHSTETELQR